MNHGWEKKRLGDVCKINFGNRIVAKDTKPGPYYVYGGGGATFTTMDYNRENCMIVSRFAMSPECVRFVRGRFFLNDSGLSVNSIKDFLTQEFIDKYLWAIQPKIYSLGRGAAQKNLNTKSFSELTIPLPAVNIQHKIVSEIDKLNELIELKRNQLKDLDAFAQSLFYETFGDPIDNPKGWELKKFKDILFKIGSGATPRGGKQSYQGGDISLIRSLNIYNTYFKYDELAKINEEQAYELRNVKVQYNDVLLNITGASVARCYIVPMDTLPARVNQHVAILRPNNEFIQSVFLHRLLVTSSLQNFLIGTARGKSATREALPKATLEMIEIIVPPIEVQNKFASKIEAIEEQKRLIESSIADLETLLASRMDYWFND